VKDLVYHPRSGVLLDFAEEDFGGVEQDAVIADWLARRAAGTTPLTVEGEFICRQHRNHERPSLYMRKDREQIIAAHWPGSGLEGTHEIAHGVSDEHRRQVDYLQRAGEAEGFEVRTEVHLPTRVIPDAVVYGPRVNMGVEVQRSKVTATHAKARTTKARHAGVLPVWFSDAGSSPRWFEQVPGVRMNPSASWATLPEPRTVTVVGGVREIVPRRCRDWPGSPCPQHSRGCTRWHPDHAALPVWADELPAYVPAGKLVPMVFRTFTGREQVFIVRPDDKERKPTRWSRSTWTCSKPTTRAPATRRCGSPPVVCRVLTGSASSRSSGPRRRERRCWTRCRPARTRFAGWSAVGSMGRSRPGRSRTATPRHGMPDRSDPRNRSPSGRPRSICDAS
jgi:hypothetical protein